MKYLNKEGLAHLWAKITDGLNTKVDKVSDKGLSTNDYTTAEKEKLAGIAEGANKTIVDSELNSTSTNPVQNKVVNNELAKKADQSTFDGSYYLGSFNNKTIADLQAALTTWLDTYGNICGASAHFDNCNNGWIDLWNSGDTSSPIEAGWAWSVTVIGAANGSYLRISHNNSKLIYYVSKGATWRQVYQVAFKDEVNAIASQLTNKANKTHTHDPNDLILGEYTQGGLDPISRGWVGSAASNKSLGLPAESVYVEYSTNGGSTWTPYSTLDGSKLFDESRSASFYLGGSSAKGQQTTGWQLRVTITSTDRYCSFDSIYQWMSDNGNTVVFDLERSTIGDPDNFTKIISDKPLDGWAGNNIHYFPNGTFCYNEDQPHNYGKYRLTYKMTSVNTNYIPAEIIDIRFFGVNIWGTSGISSSTLLNMLKTSTPYTFDVANKKVVFPDTVVATTFNGKASKVNLEVGKLDTYRPVWIDDTTKTGTPNYNDNFTYNPAQGDLKVNKIKGKETDKLATYISQTNDPGENSPLASGTLLLIHEE